MAADIISTSRKAHIINEDKSIYGTFAEIGAGQEVARHFFQAGHASNTVAKTMSAYDMTFSDEIYGKASRYVSKQRLEKMLDHEFDLLKTRLDCNNRCFFAFADTVATSSHIDDNRSHAWMGIRFQGRTDGPTNDIVVHVQLKDRLRLAQQEALGILGVNLIYGAWFLAENERMFVSSLMDNLTTDRLQIDYLHFSGPDLDNLNCQLASLELLAQKMTEALIFAPSGEILQASDYLYNKPCVILRGTYKPITKMNLEILDRAEAHVQKKCGDKSKDLCSLLEFTIKDVDDPDHLNYEDYLQRIEAINACGLPVLVSNFPLFFQLKKYIRNCTDQPLSIVIGSSLLERVFDPKYYNSLPGGILEAMGRLFDQNTQLLVFPFKTATMCTSVKTYFPEKSLSELYKHLLQNNNVEDIAGCEDIDTSIHSNMVREMLIQKSGDWQSLLPEPVLKLVEEKNYFKN